MSVTPDAHHQTYSRLHDFSCHPSSASRQFTPPEKVHDQEVTKSSQRQEYRVSDVIAGVNQSFEGVAVLQPGRNRVERA